MTRRTLVGRAAARGWQALLAVLMVLTLLGTTPGAHAAGSSCTVAVSGGRYTTIQAAVNDSGCTTIDVAAGTYTENVTIGRSVTINGATTGTTIVDGNNAGSVFRITSGTVTLANLTIQHGSGTTTDGFGYVDGGGIYNAAAGILTVTNSIFTGNTSGQYGGGIFSYGTLTVTNSTFSGNSVLRQGGAISSHGRLIITNSTFSDNHSGCGGGLYIYSTAASTITNSTFSGNSTTNFGGGICLNAGTLTVTNSTFSNNSSPTGGGIHAVNGQGTLTLINSIVANSSSGGDCAEGNATSSSHNNLIDDANNACGLANGVNGNIVGQNPKLGPLATNGGPTQTFALLVGSPAIDAASAADCPATDQRGVARPQSGGCDIGAYELVATMKPIVTVSFPTPNGQNGWFTTTPVIGSVTAVGQASITAISCTDATVSNLQGIGTASAFATLSVSGEGSHPVTCRATDSAGQSGFADGSQNTATVKIDSIAPETTIMSGPSDPTTSTAASFTFSGSDTDGSGVASYQCALDSGAFATCTSPASYSGLSIGSHTFQVRAVDKAGTVDATPASASFTVVPPSRVTTSFTPNGTNGWFITNPAIGSVTVDGNITITAIRCDNATVSDEMGLGTTSARATVSVTGEGSTFVTCRAFDSVGQVGVAAGVFVKVDTVAPTTTITDQPATITTSTDARFSFSIGESDSNGPASYACALDGGPFAACTSPQSYTGLGNGQHTFQVRATDYAGNVEAAPVSATWTINAPTATPTSTPLPPTSTPTATPTSMPTNTPLPTSTSMPTNTPVPPTSTPTNTPLPPTATATNTPLPTSTSMPTNTPVPLTATATTTSVPPTSTPTNTPVNTPVPPADNNVLDSFNRANGTVGTNWEGLTGSNFYKVAANKLDVEAGGPLLWKATSFGTSQEAFVTLSTIDSKSPAQGVLLKVQTGSIPDAGAISVTYDAKAKAVVISTLRLGAKAWTLYPSKAATFTTGDVLKARALANGTVEVYRNGTLVTTVTLNAADKTFFTTKGGKIGIWTLAASKAVLDDFGGGTIAP